MTAAATGDLGIYAHVPFCKHACPYCDFYKIELRDRPARARLDFPAQLGRELELALDAEPGLRARSLETIYFGGGTPTTLVPAAVGELIARIRACFAPNADVPEVTLEANPENLTEGRAAQWAAAGVTRLSIGVQSFAPEDLARLERLHRPETILDAVRHARDAGIRNISLDLMFALPGQTMAGWLANLRGALALEPEHLSFYGLTLHEGTPFWDEHRAGSLRPLDEDAQAAMYEAGAELLIAAGFEHYEISNFARPGFRSRHNQRYWMRRDVLALGPGAHGSIGALRWHNPEDLDGWARAIAEGRLARQGVERLDARQALCEALFCHLRRAEGIMRDQAPELFRAVAPLARRLAETPGAEGWFRIDEERIALTRAGWLVSDALVERLAGADEPPESAGFVT